jgi:hypothetical protein
VCESKSQIHICCSKVVSMGRQRTIRRYDSIYWFGSREMFHKIRKVISPEYLKRFPLYFEQYGCIHCKRRDVPHCANGMCSACSVLIRLRFDRIGKRLLREKQPAEPERATIYLRKVSSARQLLEDMLCDPANKKFMPKKSPPVLTPYMGKRSNHRVFKSEFDTGKLAWKRI